MLIEPAWKQADPALQWMSLCSVFLVMLSFKKFEPQKAKKLYRL